MDRRKFLKSLFIGSVTLAVGAKGLKEILTKEPEPETPTRLSEDVSVLSSIDAEAELTTILSEYNYDEIDREIVKMLI